MIDQGDRFLTTFDGWAPAARVGGNLPAAAALSGSIPLSRFRKDRAMFAIPAANRPLGLAASLFSCLLFVAFAAGPAAAADDQGFLGIKLQDLTPSLAKALQLDDRPGVLINEVVEGGPAQKAGLLDGDVILQLNGQAVSDTAALTESVQALAPGHKTRVLVLRNGKQKSIDVEIGKREGLADLKELEKLGWSEGEPPQVYFYDDGKGDDDIEDDGEHRIVIRTMDDTRGWLGVKLDALNDQLGDYFGVKDGAGVLVTEVVEDSPAAGAGLQAGDVIVKVGDEDVASPDALHEALAGTKAGDERAVQVLRKGSRRTVNLKLGEMPRDAMTARRIEIIRDGEAGNAKMIAPRMLRRMGRTGDGDESGEREIIIEHKRRAAEDLADVRQEMEALRQELQQLREELKR
jgi:serine protease Do